MSSEEGASALHKINVHILTRFIAVTILSYLDRTNLAFAAIQLNQQLGFTDYIYGLGSSVFFISYSLCQVTAAGSLQCAPGAWSSALLLPLYDIWLLTACRSLATWH